MARCRASRIRSFVMDGLRHGTHLNHSRTLAGPAPASPTPLLKASTRHGQLAPRLALILRARPPQPDTRPADTDHWPARPPGLTKDGIAQRPLSARLPMEGEHDTRPDCLGDRLAVREAHPRPPEAIQSKNQGSGVGGMSVVTKSQSMAVLATHPISRQNSSPTPGLHHLVPWDLTATKPAAGIFNIFNTF